MAMFNLVKSAKLVSLTLTALVPYVFTTMSALILMDRDRRRSGSRVPTAALFVAVLAFVYSVWAIAGAGKEIVYWGFLLLLAGIPVYVWVIWNGKNSEERSRAGSAP